MADIVPSSVRSRMMAGIKGKNSQPEMLVRRMLFAAGYRFRLHRRDLPGAPDIVMPSKKIAIFVHGCFWHAHRGCKYFKLPATRPDFWSGKLQGNAERDKRAIDALTAMGWRVLCVWECATRRQDTVERLEKEIVDWINGNMQRGDIGGQFTCTSNLDDPEASTVHARGEPKNL